MSEVKNITVTVIFDGSALNRDEKIGNNVLSIKKLTILGRPYSYISRQAMRHYLFNTLKRAYPEDWKEAAVKVEKDVIQFDITKDDIISSAELDAFGYMFTISGQNSITRKAPLGITKAISLFPYNQDMSFGANHDLVRRAREQGEEANPNIYNGEENRSLFKVSFTIDVEFLGKDVWITNNYEYSENNLRLNLGNDLIKKIDHVYKKSENNGVYEIKKEDKVIGCIGIDNLNNNRYKVTFKVSNEIKKKRIRQILEAIEDGLIAHSSGEDNTIVPLFLIAAPVKVPTPIFHSYIDISIEKGKIKVIGLKDCVKNSWLCDKVYIKDTERIPVDTSDIQDKLYKSWEDFLKACGLEDKKEEERCPSSE